MLRRQQGRATNRLWLLSIGKELRWPTNLLVVCVLGCLAFTWGAKEDEMQPAVVILWPKASKVAETVSELLKKGSDRSGLAVRQVYHATIPSSKAATLQQQTNTKGCGKTGKSLTFLLTAKAGRLEHLFDEARSSAAQGKGKKNEKIAEDLNDPCLSLIVETKAVETLAGVSIDQVKAALAVLPEYQNSIRREEGKGGKEILGGVLALEAGGIAYQSGDSDAAIRFFRQAVELHPWSGMARTSLGKALSTVGEMKQALQELEKAVTLQPKEPDFRTNFALALEEAGNLEGAAREYREALALAPSSSHHLVAMAHIQRRLGKVIEAEELFNSTLRSLASGGVRRGERLDIAVQGRAFHGLALVHAEERHNLDEGIAYLHRTVGINPRDQAALFDLGRLLLLRDACTTADVEKAAQVLEQAYNIARGGQSIEHLIQRSAVGKVFEIHALLSFANATLGRWEARTTALHVIDTATRTRCASDTNALLPPLLPALLHELPLPLGLDRMAALAYAASERRTPSTTSLLPTIQPIADSEVQGGGMLRVGYVTSGFNSHGIGRRIQDLFYLHGKSSRVQAYALSLAPLDSGDAVTSKILKEAMATMDLSAMETDERCTRINAVRIHVLVTLDGWGSGRAMRLLATRAAPIQVSYMSRDATSGADFVDWKVSDQVSTPPELASHLTEKLLLMPWSHLMRPHARSRPAPVPAPAPRSHVLLACLSRIHKLGPRDLESFARIGARLPSTATLQLSNLSDAAMAATGSLLREHGWPRRLAFLEPAGWEGELARGRVDAVLDSGADGGASAGMEAMEAVEAGVPLVTCAGEKLGARLGASMALASGGGGVSVARTQEDLEDIACKLTSTLQGTAALRHMRETALKTRRLGLNNERQLATTRPPQTWGSGSDVDASTAAVLVLERLLRGAVEVALQGEARAASGSKMHVAW